VHRLSTASVLATALLALERAGATGVLHVESGAGNARLAIAGGTPRAVTGVQWPGDALGERLAQSGDLRRDASSGVARRAGRGLPVGRLLIDVGAARPEAVAYALRTQLQERVRVLFGREGVSLRFVEGPAAIGVPHVGDPVSVADLVLGAVRLVVADSPHATDWQALRAGAWCLTPLGEALLDRATLWPAEAAFVAALRAETDMVSLEVGCRDAARVTAFFAGLRALRAVSRRGECDLPSTLLLRKTLELRQQRDARTLLELTDELGPAAARRSFRRLAGALHPDRLGPHASEALRRASTEVFVALQTAVGEIR